MKRKLLAILLMVLLLLPMLTGVTALSPLCFVANNDSVPLILSGGEAPYYSGSRLYIPHNAFDASPNGVGASYNAEKNTFVLFNRDQTLIFDLKEKTYTDKANKTYQAELLFRGGIVYLPASIAGHFGLSVTLLFSRYGYPIIRFTDGSQVYDDGTFVAQAENLIGRAVEEYERNSQSFQNNTNDLIGREEDATQNQISVYLAFTGDSVNRETLDMLTTMSAHGAFFLTEEQILADKQLVRDIYAAGHTIGLTVKDDEWDIASTLQRANDALDEVLFCRSLFLLLPRGLSFQTRSYRVLPEPAAETIDSILDTPEKEHLFVVRSGAPAVVAELAEGGAALLRLRETTF